MADQLKNVMIGLFVMAATVIVIFILMFLHPRVGNKGKSLHVRFTDIDKVTIGTRVTYGGRPVGEVIDIQEIEEGREGRTDSSGHVYLYDLTLQVDSGVKVFNTDTVSTRTSGLLGEKNIEITPYAPKKGEPLIEIDAKPIYAIETSTVEDTLKELRGVSGKFEGALVELTETLSRIQHQELIEKITRTVENVESITAALNKPRELSEILDNVHRLSASVNQTWATVDAAAHHINEAAMHFSSLSLSGKNIFDEVKSGQGTFGKLLYSEDFYLRFSSIMSKLETTLDDINHYGLLFQNDKGWQRLRARRLNLLQKLSSPQEFRNYFNDEIDQISTSLSRVYMVLNEMNCDPCCCDLMQDREFTKVFAELMRRVTMLEEEVRMYNTQVVEAQVHETELNNNLYCPQ